MRTSRKLIQILVPLLTVALLSGAAFAMMASNTVPGSDAGSGSGTISGYTVSNVRYTLNESSDTISGVKFDLDKAATTVYAKISDGSTTYLYNCTNTGENSWNCTAANQEAPIAGANSLQVVAAQ